MTGLNLTQLKQLIVKPALTLIGLDTPVAINLVTGTAVVESKVEYLHQVGSGPALGLWQMEPATERDCWTNYLKFNASLMEKVEALLAPYTVVNQRTQQLVWNLYYAASMCRIRYKRSPKALPGNVAVELANYWKTVYNSNLGAGAVDASHIAMFRQAIDA